MVNQKQNNANNSKLVFYTRFKHPESKAISFKEPSLVQPQFGYESDINNLVKTVTDKNGKQYAVWTGISSNLPSNNSEPLYGDFTMFTPEKLMEAKNLVARAQSEFEFLPSNIRKRFENDPAKLIEFLNDDSNYLEALKLGLVNKRPEIPKDDIPGQILPQPTPDKVTEPPAT